MSQKPHPFLSEVVFFDCEATGLVPSKSELIEIGIINSQAEILFSSLIKPTQGLSPRIEGITGITSCDLKDAPSEKEVLLRAHPLFQSASAIGGYFVHLDKEYLRFAYQRAGISNLYAQIEQKPFLCAKSLARRILKDLALDFNLENLCSTLSVRCDNSHRAVDDALSSFNALCALALRTNISSTEELLAFQGDIVESPWELPEMSPSERAESRMKWKQFALSTLSDQS